MDLKGPSFGKAHNLDLDKGEHGERFAADWCIGSTAAEIAVKPRLASNLTYSTSFTITSRRRQGSFQKFLVCVNQRFADCPISISKHLATHCQGNKSGFLLSGGFAQKMSETSCVLGEKAVLK